MNKTPTQRLIETLIEIGAPKYMIARARSGRYDSLRTPIEQFPVRTLVNDAMESGLTDLALRVADGEFDVPLRGIRPTESNDYREEGMGGRNQRA